MDDAGILRQIERMTDEEQSLYRRAEDEHGMTADEKARLRHLEVTLDQCWDLLRQRRALREAGQDPNRAKLRDAKTVEGYLA